MQRFRIKSRDTIKATACCSVSRKLLSSVYDSGFTTIESVKSALMRKIPYYNGSVIDVSIVNTDEETYKSIRVRVNC